LRLVVWCDRGCSCCMWLHPGCTGPMCWAFLLAHLAQGFRELLLMNTAWTSLISYSLRFKLWVILAFLGS
jgi:hypothetical protein